MNSYCHKHSKTVFISLRFGESELSTLSQVEITDIASVFLVVPLSSGPLMMAHQLHIAETPLNLIWDSFC